MKKFITATIAAIMIVISAVPVFAAVSPSDAVVNIDFANGIPAGMEVVGAELVNDADKGQVLSFAGGATGSSKATIPMASLATTDFSAGLSFTVWAKAAPADELHGMAPIFTVDFTRIGYLSLLSDLVLTSNTDGNETSWGIERVWSDPPQPVDAEVSVLENEWAQYTVVIDDEATYLYVNGKLYEKDPFAQGSLFDIPGVLLEEMEYATGITLGSYNCDWWKFGDFKGLMSSAALYNKALTAAEVEELFTSTKEISVQPAAEAPAATETEAPAAEETKPAAETAPAAETKTATAPATFDSVTVIAIISVIALAGFVFFKNLKNSKKAVR